MKGSPDKTDPDGDDDDRAAVSEDRKQEVMRRASQWKRHPVELTGFEDDDTRQLVKARQAMRSYGMQTLKPILPLLLQLKHKPYTLKNHFPFEPLFRTRRPKRSVYKTARQVAKCGAFDDSVLRLDNGQQVVVADLKVGDRVLTMTDDFRFVSGRVAAIVATGRKEVFKIKTRLGADFKITVDHRLRLLDGYVQCRDLRIGDRLAGVREGGEFGQRRVRRDRIILTAYMVGDGCCGLSGNWSLTTGCREVADEFEAVASKLQEIPVRVAQKEDTTAVALCFMRHNALAAWLIEDNLAFHYAWEKRIPAWCFDLSQQDTALFLSRLWATDGSIRPGKKQPGVSYSTTSNGLARDVRSLLNKFGIPAAIKRKPAGYTKDGNYVRCRDAFVVRVETRKGLRRFFAKIKVPGKPSLPLPCTRENNNRDTVPVEVGAWIAELAEATKWQHVDSLLASGLRFTLEYPLSRRKLKKYVDYFERLAPQHPRLPQLKALYDGQVIWDEIVSIERLGKQTTYDLEVETTHNFVLDGVVSHNSTCLAAKAICFSASVPDHTTLFVTPLYEMVRRLSQNYVGKFITDSPVRRLFVSSKEVQNVLQRSFVNGSALMFSYAFLDPERCRGYPSDEVIYDEFQNMNRDFCPIIDASLDGSPWAMVSKFGTPKSMDNGLEAEWQESSQAEWVTRCHHGGCNHWNVPAVSHDLYDMIGPYRDDISDREPGVVCAKCRNSIDPRRHGRWVHAFPDRRWNDVGYHIPQIIMPMHYASPEKWADLLAKQAGLGNMTATQFMNEVCGESCDTGSKLVTLTDLVNASTLPWTWKAESAVPRINNYLVRVLAVDWGGGGGRLSNAKKTGTDQQRLRTSFTTLAVLGIKHDGKIDVLWGYRSLRTHDMLYEAQLCIEAYGKFKCKFLVSDYSGAGSGRETILHLAGLPAENIISMAYHGARHNLVNLHQPTEDNPRPWYSVDRSRSLVLTCQCIKFGLLNFPQYHKETGGALLADFLALIEEKLDARIGTDVYTIVRNPTQSDDFAHSVNMGCCALWYTTKKYPDLAWAAKFTIPDEILNRFVHPLIDWSIL